mmetsp:Transcript_20439/g.60927  ORF Transcript_20439/g.60927 Transcript_20439/m.60927 type:complete len:200 (+) Transcript_20439:67-666(+)
MPNQPLAASLRSALISSSKVWRFCSASAMRCSRTLFWPEKRSASALRCSALDCRTSDTVGPARTSMARMTRSRPTPRVDHIWLPKVAEAMEMTSPTFTSPMPSALPPLMISLTKTSPWPFASRTRPMGLRMVTLRSPALASRAARSKSVSLDCSWPLKFVFGCHEFSAVGAGRLCREGTRAAADARTRKARDCIFVFGR